MVPLLLALTLALADEPPAPPAPSTGAPASAAASVVLPAWPSGERGPAWVRCDVRLNVDAAGHPIAPVQVMAAIACPNAHAEAVAAAAMAWTWPAADAAHVEAASVVMFSQPARPEGEPTIISPSDVDIVRAPDLKHPDPSLEGEFTCWADTLLAPSGKPIIAAVTGCPSAFAEAVADAYREVRWSPGEGLRQMRMKFKFRRVP